MSRDKWPFLQEVVENYSGTAVILSQWHQPTKSAKQVIEE